MRNLKWILERVTVSREKCWPSTLKQTQGNLSTQTHQERDALVFSHDHIQTRKESKQESKQSQPCKSPEGRGVISKMMQEVLWSRIWEETTWDLKMHVFYIDGAVGEEAYESTMRREGWAFQYGPRWEKGNLSYPPSDLHLTIRELSGCCQREEICICSWSWFSIQSLPSSNLIRKWSK